MTEVLVRRAPDGTITELQVKGHTGYAEQGEDIVCAGVTVLAVTALIGLKRVAGHPHEGKARHGLMHCKLKPGGTPESAAKAQVILETTVLGLLDIEKDYPKYVRVTEGG
ncbi:MAG TPA: ribosomal-processing cysteine protease Prp [Symbiobacteriaceae bacterium]|nr:ribosomal-processing cysteine protease Prp [Symbiobacteriaceae bacterium]